MKDYLNKKVLLTCANWLYGPDAKQYRAVWGTLRAIHEVKNIFGFVPNRSHANWTIEVGDMVIMGCQVSYCMLCPEQPKDIVSDERLREHELAAKPAQYTMRSDIFITT